MADARTPPRWRPPPLIRGSVALHLAAAGATLARPRLWPRALAAVAADHLVLTAAGLWPRSRLLGLFLRAARRSRVHVGADEHLDLEDLLVVGPLLAHHPVPR